MPKRKFNESREEMESILRCLQPGAEEITLEAASKCCAVEIKVTEMTGRQQRGEKYTYWRYSFE